MGTFVPKEATPPVILREPFAFVILREPFAFVILREPFAFVILREPFAFVILMERSDRRIWLRINSATEESHAVCGKIRE